jgi:hypothetical protein
MDLGSLDWRSYTANVQSPIRMAPSSLFIHLYPVLLGVELLESLKRMFSGQLHQLVSFSSKV